MAALQEELHRRDEREAAMCVLLTDTRRMLHEYMDVVEYMQAEWTRLQMELPGWFGSANGRRDVQ